MKVKVVFGSDIRRWRLPSSDAYDALREFVSESWSSTLPDRWILQYEDDEGDMITISSQADINEGLTSAQQEGRKSFKITITDVGGDDDMMIVSNPVTQVRQVSSAMSEVSIVDSLDQFEIVDDNSGPVKDDQTDAADEDIPIIDQALEEAISQATDDDSAQKPQQEVTIEEVKNDDSDDEVDVIYDQQTADEPTTEKPKPKETKPAPKTGCEYWKEMIADFLGQSVIREEINDAVAVLMESLKRGDTLQVALDMVFASCELIAAHPLIQHVRPFIAVYIPRVAHFVPVLMAMGTEAVQALVPQIVEAIKTTVTQPRGSRVNLDVAPFFKMMSPQLVETIRKGIPNGQTQDIDISGLFGLQPGAAANAYNAPPEDDQSQVPDSEVVHKGVICDGCGMDPITGARYKSAVLPDFDLCGDCEEKGVPQHPKEYPMVKFVKPLKKDDGKQMKGLKEVFWPRHRNRCGRGGRGGRHGWGRGRGRGCGNWWKHIRDMKKQWMAQNGQSGCPWKAWQGNSGQGRSTYDWANGQHATSGGPATADKPEMSRRNTWGPGFRGGRGGGCGRGRGGWGGWHQPPQMPPMGPFGHGAPQGPPGFWGHMMQQHEQARQAAMDENSNEGTYSYSGTWGGRGRGYKGKHAGCKKLKADFVTDVTIPDRSCYLPSQTLIKTWKMKNSGGIQWDGVTLNFVKGDSAMTMEQRFPVENAKPGDTVDVHAVIQTPDKPGRYCAYYRLCGAGLVSKKAGEGKMFGPRIWTDIIVVKDLQDLKERARLDDGPTRDQEKRAKQLRKKAAKVENREDKLKVQVSKLEFQKTKMEAKLKHTQAKLDQVQSTKAKFQNKAEQSTQEKKARKLAKQADKKEKKEAKLRNKLAKMENNLENKQATIAAKRAELEQASDDALLYGHAQEVAEEAIKPSSPMSSPADDEKCDYAVSSAVPSEPAPEAPDMSEQWDCMCGSVTNGNFCGDCGSKRPEKAKVAPPAPFAVIPFKYDAQLSTLLGMGFPDVTLNKFLLNKNDGNVERVVDFLFKQMNA